MGGCTFFTEVDGPNPTEAFRRAVDDALYEYGHRGYTGTIAEKSEFALLAEMARTPEEAQDLACKLIEDNDWRIADKWGPCGCIAIEPGKLYLFFGWASC